MLGLKWLNDKINSWITNDEVAQCTIIDMSSYLSDKGLQNMIDYLQALQRHRGVKKLSEENTCGRAGCTNRAKHLIMVGNMNYYTCDEHLAEAERLK